MGDCIKVVALEILILLVLIYIGYTHANREKFLAGNFDDQLFSSKADLEELQNSKRGRIMHVTGPKGEKISAYVYPANKIPVSVLLADVQGKVV
jgi:hypothetical protein